MKKISQDKYVEGVNSIYIEQPGYKSGKDGSNGECDCIGMGRGALKREGVGDVKGMNGTNYAARHTILDLQTGTETDTGLPKSNVLYYEMTDDAWLCVRPSGTEPKIKFYYGIVGTSLEDAGRLDEEFKKKIDEMVSEMV